MTKLVLFDIDHTLMEAGVSHKKAFAEAFKDILDIDIDFKKWKYHGYTDLQIIHEIMDKNKVDKDPSIIELIISHMIKIFKNMDLSDSLLLPGVKNLLEQLQSKDIIIGLVTGNIEEIAYTKLKHFGIDETFIVGGFGHSSVIRSELIDFAIERANAKINKKDVIVIGDTIRDIQAAKEANVKIVAVATGTYTKEQLEGKKPDYLFKDLTDTEKIIDVIMHG